jgi:hypothetical protein
VPRGTSKPHQIAARTTRLTGTDQLRTT